MTQAIKEKLKAFRITSQHETDVATRVAQYGGVGGGSAPWSGSSSGSSGGGQANSYVVDISLDGLMAKTHKPAPIDPQRNMEKRLEPFHTWAEEDLIPYELSPKERTRLKLRKEVRRRERSYEDCARSLYENSPAYIKEHYKPSSQQLMTMEEQLGARRRNEIADKEKREKGEDPRAEAMPKRDTPTRRHPVDIPHFMQPVYASTRTVRFLESIRLAGDGYSLFRQPNRMQGEEEGTEDDTSGYLKGRYQSQPELIGSGTGGTIEEQFQHGEEMEGREDGDNWSDAYGDDDMSKPFWNDNFVSNQGIEKPQAIPSAIKPAASDSSGLTLEQKLETTKKDHNKQRLPKDNSGVRDEYNAYKEEPRGNSEIFDAGAAPDVGGGYGNRMSLRVRTRLASLRLANESEDGQIYNFYHGTRNKDLRTEDLKEHTPSYQGSLGGGVYVGQNRDTAAFYSGGTDNVLDVPVRLKNPLMIDRSEGINFRLPNRNPNEEYEKQWNSWDDEDEDSEQEQEQDPDEVDYDWHDMVNGGMYDSILPGERVPPFDVLIGGEWCEVRDHYSLSNLRIWAERAGHDAIILNGLRDGHGPQEEVLVFNRDSIVQNPLNLTTRDHKESGEDHNDRYSSRVKNWLSSLRFAANEEPISQHTQYLNARPEVFDTSHPDRKRIWDSFNNAPHTLTMAEFASHPDVMWHGSPWHDFGQGENPLVHVGTWGAAHEALSATVAGQHAPGDVPALTPEPKKEKYWKHKRGMLYRYSPNRKPKIDWEEVDHSWGVPAGLKPVMVPLKITGPMANGIRGDIVGEGSRGVPPESMLKSQLKRGIKPKNGYFYKNEGEGMEIDKNGELVYSTSAVVPHRSWVKTHEDFVREALENGLQVPSHVLAEYPHLTMK